MDLQLGPISSLTSQEQCYGMERPRLAERHEFFKTNGISLIPLHEEHGFALD